MTENAAVPKPSRAIHRRLVTDILDAGNRADPYPLYERIRDVEPVWLEHAPVVVFASAAACEAVLRDPRASSERRFSTLFTEAGGDAPPVPELSSFMFLDPPAHTHIRGLVSKAFTPRVVRNLGAQVETIVADLLDAVAGRTRMEVVADLARPLPLKVICRMLDIPAEAEDWIRRRSSLLARAQDPFLAFTGRQPPGFDRRHRAEEELNAYFEDLAGERCRRPGDDLVSGMVTAEADGRRLSLSAVATSCRFLVNAGHETTVNLLAASILTLIRDPGRRAEVAADPARADDVVEEALTYDPPVHLVHRFAREDMVVNGTVVPRGTTMVLLLAGANRDPAVAPGPGTDRPGARQFAFGLGRHYCLGAALARLEARAAVAQFARRVVGPRFAAPDLRYKELVTLRGLETLPIEADRILGREPAMPDAAPAWA